MTPEDFYTSIKDRLAIDVETEGQDPLTAKLVGVGFASSSKDAIWTTDANVIQRLLGLPLPKWGHNIKFDLEVLMNHGYKIGGKFDDTHVLARVDGRYPKCGLKNLANSIFGANTLTYKELVDKYKPIKHKPGSIRDIPPKVLANYCMNDCKLTLQLADHLLSTMDEKSLAVYRDIEQPLIKILVEMERLGIQIDAEKLKEVHQETGETLSLMNGLIEEQVGYDFNINSTQQLSKYLFEDLKCPIYRLTKKDKRPQTDEKSLQRLYDEGYTIAGMMVKYREKQKLKSAFLDNYLEQVDGNGRLHTVFKQVGAGTGRMSCGEKDMDKPNLQQVPKGIQHLFIARPGYTLIEADFKQMELVMAANITKDKNYQQIFKEGQDLHEEISKMYKIDRRRAKAVNFGILFGSTEYGLSQTLKMKRELTKLILKEYKERFPGVFKFMMDQTELIKTQGYIETIYGRRRYIDVSKHKEHSLNAIAINTPIQGSCADVVKIGMQKVYNALPKEAKLVLQVHDALVVECPDQLIDVVSVRMKESLEGHYLGLEIPFRVSIKIGKSWGEMTELSAINIRETSNEPV